MDQMERDRLCFLQELSRFLESREIRCTFQTTPRVDRDFWNRAAGEIGSSDEELLAKIAQCLRSDTSDFDCVEEILALLEARGFSTTPRHDFS